MKLLETPISEVEIDGTLVYNLLENQHPDLASIWMLFSNSNTRQDAIAEYGNVSKYILQRAKVWAIFFGVAISFKL